MKKLKLYLFENSKTQNYRLKTHRSKLFPESLKWPKLVTNMILLAPGTGPKLSKLIDVWIRFLKTGTANPRRVTLLLFLRIWKEVGVE